MATAELEREATDVVAFTIQPIDFATTKAAERERQRIEALRPDREKLMAVADAVRSITIPSVSEDAQGLADEFASLLRSTADKITSAVERMIPTQESAS